MATAVCLMMREPAEYAACPYCVSSPARGVRSVSKFDVKRQVRVLCQVGGRFNARLRSEMDSGAAALHRTSKADPLWDIRTEPVGH